MSRSLTLRRRRSVSWYLVDVSGKEDHCDPMGHVALKRLFFAFFYSLCLQVCQTDRYSPGLPVHQSLTLSLRHAQSEVQSADFTE